MVDVYPFRALRPAQGCADKIASVPYDVLSTQEARDILKARPQEFLQVTRSEALLEESLRGDTAAVFAHARKNLEGMIRDGLLVHESDEAFFIYRLTMGDHAQTGVVLTASVDDYDTQKIRRHEHTRPDKEDDRVRHMEALDAQTGVVFLLHQDDAALAAEVEAAVAAPSEVDFVAVDGVRHQVWSVANPSRVAAVSQAFAAMSALYVADGHHRSAAASRMAKKMGQEASKASASQTEPALWARFLAVSFPVSQTQILPYHRVVRDLGDKTPNEFLTALGAAGLKALSAPTAAAEPPKVNQGEVALFLAEQWHLFALPQHASATDAAGQKDWVGSLDVSVLQNRVLEPLLGIVDPRRDPKIGFVGGIRGMKALANSVLSGSWQAAFAMAPTPIEALLAVAEQGEVMPPKSTWFEPKLRDGLFVHPLVDDLGRDS